MLWSINIGSIGGTVIRVHITFVLFLAWIAASSWFSGGATAAWYTLAFMILLFACVSRMSSVISPLRATSASRLPP